MCNVNNMNESVKKFLEGQDSGMTEYFEECSNDLKKPNYSEMCRKYLNGTTAEGVAFDDISLSREYLTEFLRKKYKLWLSLR